MKRHSGLIFSVFSTLGNYLGIEPWILRIIGIVFISDILGLYFIMCIFFSLFLDDDDSFDDTDDTDTKMKSPKIDYI